MVVVEGDDDDRMCVHAHTRAQACAHETRALTPAGVALTLTSRRHTS
jgi:hypothetical protein